MMRDRILVGFASVFLSGGFPVFPASLGSDDVPDFTPLDQI
jgi:hypothetical protein